MDRFAPDARHGPVRIDALLSHCFGAGNPRNRSFEPADYVSDIIRINTKTPFPRKDFFT